MTTIANLTNQQAALTILAAITITAAWWTWDLIVKPMLDLRREQRAADELMAVVNATAEPTTTPAPHVHADLTRQMPLGAAVSLMPPVLALEVEQWAENRGGVA